MNFHTHLEGEQSFGSVQGKAGELLNLIQPVAERFRMNKQIIGNALPVHVIFKKSL